MYNVVFRSVATDVITWSSFRDKGHFDEWYGEEMKALEGVVEQGVSRDRAIELCSTPEAIEASISSKLQELQELLG